MQICCKPNEMLTLDEKNGIHKTSCKILEEIGVKVQNSRLIELLVSKGAFFEKERLRIPVHMVEKALKTVPRSIRFNAPNPERAFTVDADGTDVFLGTGGQALYVLRHKHGEWTRDSAGSKDLEEIVSLCDRLQNIDFVTRPVECDVPANKMDEEKALIFASNTKKPMNLANLIMPAKLPAIIDMIGDASWISFIVCLVASPLTVDDSAADKLFTIVESGIPVSISSCPQAGTTALLSEVGELIQLNAEVLFGVVLVQAINEGAPVLYRGIPITADLMSDGSPRWCQPESIRRLALAAEICRFIGIPCCGTAAVSDEKTPNSQAVSEKALSLTYEVAAGAQYINSAFGMLEQVMTVAPVQYVIDDMIVGLVSEELGTKFKGAAVGKAAKSVAIRALSELGVVVDDSIEKELQNRIEFIESRKEEYTEEAIKIQYEDLCSAINSQTTGSYFMKKARKGLRAGYLYNGNRIDVPLNLSHICKEGFYEC